MAARITTAIAKGNYETIRDAVGSLLAVELPSQATKNSLTYLNAKIYAEKIHGIAYNEVTAINLIVTDVQFTSHNTTSSRGELTIVIEVYTNSNTTSSDSGDNLAAIKNHRLANVIRTILMHPEYQYLGLNTKIIEHRSVGKIQRAIPRNEGDINNTVLSTMELLVKYQESINFTGGIALASNFTEVQVNEDEDGYEYIYEKPE